jgi:agmatinase
LGIATLGEAELPSDPEAALAALEPVCSRVLSAGKLLITLGGEHTVSLAPISAARTVCGELSILQLDAHADLRDTYLGSRYSHACTMRRARELAPVVSVGIRSFSAEEADYMRQEAISPFLAQDLQNREFAGEVIDQLLPSVYITIDLDVFDPAIMPAVGTPEPGGLGWYPVLSLLRQVAAAREIVGFDVVELAPLPGNPASDFLAAKLVYKTLAYILHHRRQARIG